MASTDATTGAGEVGRAYFGSIRHGDAGPQRRWYADDAVIDVHGVLAGATREELIAYFEELWGAFPDFRFEVLDLVATEDTAVAQWRITGTFAGPGTFQGIAPTGARVDLRGVDVIRVRDGRIVRNDAYTDNLTVAEQLGLLPPQGSPAQARMTQAVNARTRVAARLAAAGPEPVADGVWLVRGGFPSKTMNVFLVRDGDGVLAFDGGIRSMRHAVAAAAARLGGLTRIVLGHGHADHRGVAPFLGVPVHCHPADRAFAEGDGGTATFALERLNPLARRVYPHLLRHWDGGPVAIAGTVEEGDDVAGFRVVHLPGHAPGLVALWRERDRLALCSDAFYVLDPQTGIRGAPRVPHPAFNADTEQARASMRKLAGLEPATAWPGHAGPLTGDVAAQLRRAADAA
jgi:steroid delta-isomerase-like uncharacterized protein